MNAASTSAAEKASAILNANAKPLLGGAAAASSIGAGQVQIPANFQLKTMANRASLQQQLANNTGVNTSLLSNNIPSSVGNSRAMTPAPVPSEPASSVSNLDSSGINPTLNNTTLNSLNLNINAAAAGNTSSANSSKNSDGVLDLNESLLPAGHSSMSLLGGDALGSVKSD